jgi:putative transcriptional regulator
LHAAGAVKEVTLRVFAACLNTSKSMLQKWEQGQKKLNRPSLKLLNLVAEKGLEVLA